MKHRFCHHTPFHKKTCEEYGRLYTNLYGLPDTAACVTLMYLEDAQDPEGAYAAGHSKIH